MDLYVCHPYTAIMAFCLGVRTTYCLSCRLPLPVVPVFLPAGISHEGSFVILLYTKSSCQGTVL
jgi:hypothetical protein